MSNPASRAFVAYASKDSTIAKIIMEGVQRANALPLSVRFDPWEFNDIPGTPIISPILEKIDESPFIVADITYLNLNFVYEIGFAIGRNKRAFLIRYGGTAGDKEIAREAGIFDTLGYQEYSSLDELKDRLTSHIDPKPLPFSITVNNKAPVYIVEPPTRTEAATIMTSRVKKAGYRYRSFNPTEDVRLSAYDAIRQVAESTGILIQLQSPDIDGSVLQNIRGMFVAGLAHGMGKPTLILCPAGFDAPLDIRDIAKTFRVPEDVSDHCANFWPEVNDYSQHIDPLPVEVKGLLQNLSVGDPTAENEMTTLSNYYLRTDEYQRAVRGDVNLVVGRKGSGKTALFIQVRDKIRSDKRNVVVDLKPEGYQLLKLKEEILSFLTEGARQHLITAFWEYLILLEVAYKLLEKDRHTYSHNHEIYDLYLDLESTYRVENFSATGDFSERLLTLSQRLADQYKQKYGSEGSRKLTAEQVTELLFTHDIRKLRDKVSAYLARKEAVWVMFDNLDNGWSTQGVDVIDAIVLRCLIDAGRKVA